VANQLNIAIVHVIVTLKRLGWSRRRIAEELEIDRETVARYVHPPPVDSQPTTNPISRVRGGCRQEHPILHKMSDYCMAAAEHVRDNKEHRLVLTRSVPLAINRPELAGESTKRNLSVRRGPAPPTGNGTTSPEPVPFRQKNLLLLARQTYR
jgi:hypothetical protein